MSLLHNNPKIEEDVSGSDRAGMRATSFLLFMSLLTSVVAFGTDMMLPALIHIGKEYSLTNANDAQLVLVVYILAFGFSQLVFGPITDRYGRQPILIAALAVFSISSIFAIFAPSFTWLLIARLVQGIATGAARSSSSGIIRDCFSGSDMARMLSNIYAVFMVVPIFAPLVGQGIILISNWHWIFLFLGIGGLLTTIWAFTSLKETHYVENRRPLSAKRIRQAFHEILTTRVSIGYMLVSTAWVAALFAFIFSNAQVFGERYEMGSSFVLILSIAGIAMAIASALNGRLVKTYNMRRMAHLSLVAFTALTALFLLGALTNQTNLYTATLFIVITMILFAFVNSNVISIALEPMGHIAGTSSSLINTVTNTAGAIIGGIVGRMYDGTVLPLAASFFVLALFALSCALWTERGRLTLK